MPAQEAFRLIDCVPGQVRVGGVLSTLFTENEQEVELPLPSFTVNDTVVSPKPDILVPGNGNCETEGMPQLSDTLIGVYVGIIAVQPVLTPSVCGPGHTTVGEALSMRVA